MTDLPHITVAEDLDSGDFILMATSYNMTAPAGARLLKAPPHPDIKFRHATEEEARQDCKLLQEYVETMWPKQAMSKAAMRKHSQP